MVDDFDGGVSNLVGDQELMELGEVAISLKDIQQVQSQFNRLFVVISQRSGHGAQQGVVLKHDLHIFVAQTQV